MNQTDLQEQRRLMGLSPRFRYTLHEEAGDAVAISDPVHPDSPEDDEKMMATPSVDHDAPEATGAGATKHWDMYREVAESAMKLAQENRVMFERINVMAEDSTFSRDQRRSLKQAQGAVKSAWTAQREAYRRIAEFGSTVLG